MKRLFLVIAAILSGVLTWSQETRIEFITPRIVHVVKSMEGKQPKSLVVTAKPQAVSVSHNGNTWKSSGLTVRQDPSSKCLTFLTASGKVLLREKECFYNSGSWSGVCQRFTLDKDEAIYGLGTIQNGKMNRRGEHKRMEQSNLEDFQSVIQSIKGWGLYWDNYLMTTRMVCRWHQK